MSDDLSFSIDSVKVANNTFGPQLQVDCSVRTGGSYEFEVLGADVDVRLHLDARPISKRLPRVSATIYRLGIVTSREAAAFALYLDADPPILNEIERLREGGSASLQMRVRFHGRDVEEGSSASHLVDAEYELHTNTCSEILDDLDYHDTRIFEVKLDAPDVVTRDVLRSASAKLQRAQRYHDEGDYGAAIRVARDLLESLQYVEPNVQTTVDPEKWDRLSTHIGQLEKGFIGLLCHSENKTDTEPPLRRDSDFVIGQVKSYIRFVTTAIKEDQGR